MKVSPNDGERTMEVSCEIDHQAPFLKDLDCRFAVVDQDFLIPNPPIKKGTVLVRTGSETLYWYRVTDLLGFTEGVNYGVVARADGIWAHEIRALPVKSITITT